MRPFPVPESPDFPQYKETCHGRLADSPGHTRRIACGGLQRGPQGIPVRVLRLAGSGPADSAVVDVVRSCENAQDSGTHPTQAARGAETAYVITGDDLLSLNRSLDSDTPAKVIFHSHPNGRAYFSPTDREVATSPWGDGPAYPVQQVVEAALFAGGGYHGGAGGGGGRAVRLVR